MVRPEENTPKNSKITFFKKKRNPHITACHFNAGIQYHNTAFSHIQINHFFMLINHTPRYLNEICKPDGRPLFGERLMYERITKDLKKNNLEWHMFYDLNLNIRAASKSEIQIDFLLICPKGIIVIEVKGGEMQIQNGVYIN